MLTVAAESVLEYVGFSNSRIDIAFCKGAVSSLSAGVLLLMVLRLRWQLLRHERRRNQFRQNIKLNLIRLVAGEQFALPEFKRRDLPEFLAVWLHFQEILRGDSQLLLNQAVMSSGLNLVISQLLNSKRMEEQMLAATALRHLGDAQAWESLLIMLQNRSPILSMAALRALVSIDADRAAVIIMPLIAEHRDWLRGCLLMMLKQTKPPFRQAFLVFLENQVLESKPHLPRLLYLFTAFPQNRQWSLFEKLSPSGHCEPEMLSVCLRLVSHPSELPWVRTWYGDRRCQVQVQIAGVLGRMGAPQDAHYLLLLLDSEHWWVRYRAAQALVRQPSMNNQAVKRLINNRTDVFARDMLLQIVAENSRL